MTGRVGLVVGLRRAYTDTMLLVFEIAGGIVMAVVILRLWPVILVGVAAMLALS